MTADEEKKLTDDAGGDVEAPKKEVEPFLTQGEAKEAPVDKGNLVFLIIFLHGIGTLMPWNMFLTIAYQYYVNYKFSDIIHMKTPLGTVDMPKSTTLSENYMTAQNVCSQIPNLILNFVNIFIVVKGDLTKRIGVSLTVVGFCVLVTMSFIYMDTWTWQTGFFIVTLASVVVLNAANGIYQNSIFGLASDFPFKYTNAVIIGNNFCGTFVTVINIVCTSLFGKNNEMMAMTYFGISLFTIFLCFCSFFLLKKQAFFRHYTEAAKAETKDADAPKGVTFGEFLATFKEGWVGFTNVFLIFFVTLTIFPETMMGVVPDLNNPLVKMLGVVSDPNNPLVKKVGDLYMSIMVFLLFNFAAFIGSMLASWKQVIHYKRMSLYVYARILLIPAFVFLNYRPLTRGSLPVLCDSTYLYLFLSIVMSVSSGYLSSLAMMYLARYVSSDKTRTAMMMGGFFIIAGIVSGVIFGKLVAVVVDLF